MSEQLHEVTLTVNDVPHQVRVPARRLLSDGERVVDVPAKLAARVRVFDTGNARKTDTTDAHGIAAAALRTPDLRVLAFDEELVALRLLVNRRDELSARRVQTVNRLHRLLTELQDSASPVRPTSSSLTLTSERAPAISSPHRSADFSTLVDPYLTLKGEIRRAQP